VTPLRRVRMTLAEKTRKDGLVVLNASDIEAVLGVIDVVRDNAFGATHGLRHATACRGAIVENKIAIVCKCGLARLEAALLKVCDPMTKNEGATTT
jgi:hypothetical protein